jgi:hypothetical protein
LIQRPAADPAQATTAAALLTFRTHDRPDASPAPFLATRLPDHRSLYLDYEGEVSQGRGHVERVASGHVLSLDESDARIQVVCQFDRQPPRGWLALPTDAPGNAAWRFTPLASPDFALAITPAAR